MSRPYNPILAPRERTLAQRSLICLLQAVEGMVTTVELRNNNCVTGMIEHVDAFMSTTMKDVTLTSPDGKSVKFSVFFVHGSNVRYVQIPDEINIVKAIEYQCTVDQRKLDQLKKEQDYRAKCTEEKMARKKKEYEEKERRRAFRGLVGNQQRRHDKTSTAIGAEGSTSHYL